MSYTPDIPENSDKSVINKYIHLIDWHHVGTFPESLKEKQTSWPLGKQKNGWLHTHEPKKLDREMRNIFQIKST